jgi:hypothetical protein
MRNDESFRSEIIRWLEDTIQCELPGQTEVFRECELTRPTVNEGELDPQMLDMPRVGSLSEREFRMEFQRTVTNLVNVCNWHEHTETCWKYLRPGEPRDDTHCRMQIDGSTRASTDIDSKTLSVQLRHLHPRINNYNGLLMFLLQCNMDIKYISSGPAVKALVFYITDYITKSSLSVHAGLDAIRYALHHTEQSHIDTNIEGSKERSLFVKSVNTLIAR